MAAASNDETLWEFVAILNTTVGCVTHARLYAQPLDRDRYTIILENGSPARLITRQGRANLQLSIVHECHITPEQLKIGTGMPSRR